MDQSLCHSPACERNKHAILYVLQKCFPTKAKILEIASGSGQHADFFTEKMPQWLWQSSEQNRDLLKSIEGYKKNSQANNFLKPVFLDVLASNWNMEKYDAAFCANLIHICPWKVTKSLFKTLPKHLEQGAVLAIYGPFFQNNLPSAPSNIAFDQSLRSRNSEWGIRNLEAILELATKAGFNKQNQFEMPANNLMIALIKN